MSRPLVFLVATEASGDLMGSRLMQALRTLTGDQARFCGVGGPLMEQQGLQSLFPISSLSIMGAAELLPRARTLLALVRRTAEAAQEWQPDIGVLIDSWGFNSRVAARLAGRRRFPLLQFVAPKAWAWRAGRARRLAKLVDALLAQLPFEPAFFERHGLTSTFVGHPIIESPVREADPERFRSRYGLAEDEPLLAVLPGSRQGEVTRLLPVFGDVVARLQADRPGWRTVLPTLESLDAEIRNLVRHWTVAPLIVHDQGAKYDALAASEAAIAASGTVTLELALLGTPAVVAYRVHPLTAFGVRRLMTVRYVTLVNLLLDRSIIPEFLQENCTAARIGDALLGLLDDPVQRRQQAQAGRVVAGMLGAGGPAPSLRAAEAVLRWLDLGAFPPEAESAPARSLA